MTPRDVFDALDGIFGFTVDACASPDNALLPCYWTDCTAQDWSGHTAFVNPPFSLTGKILPKATTAKTAVFLLPVTCLPTRYFAQHPPRAMAIPPYRIKFVPPPGVQATQPALGTVALIYGEVTTSQLDALDQLGWSVWT